MLDQLSAAARGTPLVGTGAQICLTAAATFTSFGTCPILFVAQAFSCTCPKRYSSVLLSHLLREWAPSAETHHS